MDNWPVSLQQKLDVDGFTKRYGDARVASEMDIGPAKVRARYTDTVDGYDCQIRLELDTNEVEDFETFIKTTLGNATLPFLFDDPLTGVSTAFRFAPGTMPQLRPLGGRVFVLSMTWERLP